MFNRMYSIIDWQMMDIVGNHEIYCNRRVPPELPERDNERRVDKTSRAYTTNCRACQPGASRRAGDRDRPNMTSKTPTIRRTKLFAESAILVPTTDKYSDSTTSPSELLYLDKNPPMSNITYDQWTKHWVSVNSSMHDHVTTVRVLTNNHKEPQMDTVK